MKAVAPTGSVRARRAAPSPPALASRALAPRPAAAAAAAVPERAAKRRRMQGASLLAPVPEVAASLPAPAAHAAAPAPAPARRAAFSRARTAVAASAMALSQHAEADAAAKPARGVKRARDGGQRCGAGASAALASLASLFQEVRCRVKLAGVRHLQKTRAVAAIAASRVSSLLAHPPPTSRPRWTQRLFWKKRSLRPRHARPLRRARMRAEHLLSPRALRLQHPPRAAQPACIPLSRTTTPPTARR